MKKSITTLAFALAIAGATIAQPAKTRGQNASKPAPDAKLISTTYDGGYRVTKWCVPQSSQGDDSEFMVKYQINLARLISNYDENSKEIIELKQFVKDLLNDNEKQITAIDVCGYASPDGLPASNKKLAMRRAVDFRDYINRECNLTQYGGKTVGVAYPWSATKQPIMRSNASDKAEILKVVSSDSPAMTINNKLKGMPSSWRFITMNILPPMRCVEMNVKYRKNDIIEVRTPIESPQEVVEEVVVVENNYYVVIEEDSADIIGYENPAAAPLDFEPNEKSKFIFKDNSRRQKIKGDMKDAYGRERSSVKYK